MLFDTKPILIASVVASSIEPGSAGSIFYRVRGFVDPAHGPVYLLLCDQPNFPITGDVPQLCAPAEANGEVGFDFGFVGRTIQHNPWFVLSTTPLSYTAPTFTGLLDVQYSV